MSSLRGRCRRFKKATANPYAGRGLDKFALVSAELEAKREELAEQLDTPLSMVKFAIGSHNKWIPIVLSRSTKKGSHASKKKSGGMVTEDKSTHKGGLHNDGKATYVAGSIDTDKAHLGSEGSPTDEEQSGIIDGNRADLGTKIDGQSTQLSGFFNGITAPSDDQAPPDGLSQKDHTTLGGLIGFQRNKIIEILPAPSELEHIAAYKAEANGLQEPNSKSLMGASWVVSKASTLASNVVFLRWRTKSTRKRTASAERAPLPEKEILNEARTPRTSLELSSPSSLEKTPSASPFQAQSMSLPLPPARIKTASSNKTTDEAAIAEIMEDASASSKGKRNRKCKGKSLLKICSAPSTPRDSRQPQKPFTGATTLPKMHGLNDQAARTDAKEDQLIVHKSTSPEHALSTSRFSRASMSEKAKKEKARRIGQALAATGLLLSLSGLIMGYLSAILGVVCWWYLLPGLRKAVGDKPVVRSHLHTHDSSNTLSNTKSLNVQLNSSKAIKEAGSGKYDLQSYEYKKKVIMEGFLDRGRRSNA